MTTDEEVFFVRNTVVAVVKVWIRQTHHVLNRDGWICRRTFIETFTKDFFDRFIASNILVHCFAPETGKLDGQCVRTGTPNCFLTLPK